MLHKTQKVGSGKLAGLHSSIFRILRNDLLFVVTLGNNTLKKDSSLPCLLRIRTNLILVRFITSTELCKSLVDWYRLLQDESRCEFHDHNCIKFGSG